MKTLAAALEYAALGWPVFPCVAGTKRPATEHGLHDATTDVDQIKKWFSNGAKYNLAVVMGRGLFAVDVDNHSEDSDGEESFAALCAEHGDLPETCESRTPSGGRHLIYRSPEGVDVRNSTSKLGPGLDVRGTAGYIVVAPSATAVGNYAWHTHPAAVAPAPAPAWLLELLVPPVVQPKADRPVTHEEPATWRIREGRRNASLTSRAGQLRRIGACQEAIYAELSVINRTYCVPALDEKEVRTISESIAKCTPAEKFSAVQKYNLISGYDLDALPPLAWVCKGVFPTTGLASIYGPSGSGKSFLILDMCTAIVEGRPWFGHRTKPTACTYIALEGVGGIRQRVAAWREHHGRPTPDGLNFVLENLSLTSPTDVAALASVLPAGGVVVVDTLNRAAPGCDENSSQDMGLILAGAKVLHVATSGLVVLVHHVGKDHSKGARGHSSLFAALDAAIIVDSNNGNRTWKIDKNKDGVDGIEHAFSLESVDLGVDSDGDPVSSCIVYNDGNATPRTRPLASCERQAIDAYRAAGDSGACVDSAGSFFIPLEKWREFFYRASTADTEAGKRSAFCRARSALKERGVLVVVDDLYRVLLPDVTICEGRWKTVTHITD